MERYEMAEILSRKAGVTLEEARAALEENQWDLLDAMVALERRGSGNRTEPVDVGGRAPAGYTYSVPALTQPVKSAPEKEPVLTNGFAQLWGYIKKLVRVLVDNSFTVTRREHEVMSFPVIWLVVLLICCFWVTLPALLIGMFFGCQYHFEGTAKVNAGANRAMGQLGNAVDSAVGDVKNAMGDVKVDVKNAMGDVKDAMGSAMGGLKDAVTDAVEDVRNAFDSSNKQ